MISEKKQLSQVFWAVFSSSPRWSAVPMICEHENGSAKAGEVPNLLIGLSTFAVCV